MNNMPFGFPQYALNNMNIGSQLPRTEITKVNGRAGAEARLNLMPPNSSDLMLDETAAVIWAASKDALGSPSLTPYDISPHEDIQPLDIETINKRLTKLEELYNEHKSYSGSARESESADGQTGTPSGGDK